MVVSYSRRTILGFPFALLPVAAQAQNSIPDQLRGLLNQGAQRPGVGGSRLSDSQIGFGLKDALKVASQRVIGRVGKLDGYNGDPDIRIPLPGALQPLESPLRVLGATGILDDLRLKMNRAAEQAAPKALNIFVDAATNMTFDDARGILTCRAPPTLGDPATAGGRTVASAGITRTSVGAGLRIAVLDRRDFTAPP